MAEHVTFREFYTEWVEYLQHLDTLELSKSKKATIIGEELENRFEGLLLHFTPPGCTLLRQRKIKGVNYTWDLLFAKSDKSHSLEIDPFDTVAAFEVKYRGIYSYKKIEEFRNVLQKTKVVNRNIELFYITFRETETYTRKTHEILGVFIRSYYRLSDSGDGVQVPPKEYFPEAWDRLIKNLNGLAS